MIKKILISTIVSSVAISNLAFADQCLTHQPCAPGTTCTCNVGASGSSARYFYFNFDNIKKGVNYNCNFSNTMMPFWLQLDGSTFPAGATYQCVGSFCPRFPATVKVNTENMQLESGTVIIKYLVPASDIPANVTAECLAT